MEEGGGGGVDKKERKKERGRERAGGEEGGGGVYLLRVEPRVVSSNINLPLLGVLLWKPWTLCVCVCVSGVRLRL